MKKIFYALLYSPKVSNQLMLVVVVLGRTDKKLEEKNNKERGDERGRREEMKGRKTWIEVTVWERNEWEKRKKRNAYYSSL